MPQIMEANGAQSIFCKKLRKFTGYIVRLNQGSHLIYTNKIQIARIIAVAAQSPLVLLHIPESSKILLRIGAQRQRSHTRFAFGSMVTHNGYDFSIMLFSYNGCCNA